MKPQKVVDVHQLSVAPKGSTNYWWWLYTTQKGNEMSEAPKTMTVPEAGAIYFGLSRNASYEAAARGDLPVIRIGKLLRVPVKALERMLEQPKSTEAA